jgi:hypothetical protein
MTEKCDDRKMGCGHTSSLRKRKFGIAIVLLSELDRFDLLQRKSTTSESPSGGCSDFTLDGLQLLSSIFSVERTSSEVVQKPLNHPREGGGVGAN